MIFLSFFLIGFSNKFLTVLAQRDVEHSMRCTWWTAWAVAHVVWILLNRRKHIRRWSETEAGDSSATLNLYQ